MNFNNRWLIGKEKNILFVQPWSFVRLKQTCEWRGLRMLRECKTPGELQYDQQQQMYKEPFYIIFNRWYRHIDGAWSRHQVVKSDFFFFFFNWSLGALLLDFKWQRNDNLPEWNRRKNDGACNPNSYSHRFHMEQKKTNNKKSFQTEQMFAFVQYFNNSYRSTPRLSTYL